jgi:hypothetical protein
LTAAALHCTFRPNFFTARLQTLLFRLCLFRLQPAAPGTTQPPPGDLAAFKAQMLPTLASVSEQLANFVKVVAELAKVVAELQVLCSNNVSES